MIPRSQNPWVRNVQKLKKEYHSALDFCGSTNSQAKYLDVEVKIEDYFLLNFAFSEKCRHWINRRNLTDLRRDYFKTEYWMTFLSWRTFNFTFFSIIYSEFSPRPVGQSQELKSRNLLTKRALKTQFNPARSSSSLLASWLWPNFRQIPQRFAPSAAAG